MTLGERIARFRKLHQWTQEEMATRLGVHSSHISRWETDKVRPTLKTLGRVAEVLGVSIDELSRDQAEPSVEFQDNDMVRYLRELDRLDSEDRLVIKKVIEAMLTKKRVQDALGVQPQ